MATIGDLAWWLVEALSFDHVLVLDLRTVFFFVHGSLDVLGIHRQMDTIHQLVNRELY